MSNIVAYTTDDLSADTNFVNNFLDDLLEQFCENKYEANTVIEGICKPPSLSDLLLTAYPGYYVKAPGLLAAYASTHVIVVYESHLHNTLQEALDHKFGRLFVQVNITQGLMDLVPVARLQTTPDMFPLMNESGGLIEFLRKSADYKITLSDIEKNLINKTSVRFVSGQSRHSVRYAYKPDISFAEKLVAQNKARNEKLIEDLYFFDVSYVYKQGLNAELAYAVAKDRFRDLEKLVTPEFYKRMRNFAIHACDHMSHKARALRDVVVERELQLQRHREQAEQYERELRQTQYRYELERRKQHEEFVREQQRKRELEEQETLERLKARNEAKKIEEKAKEGQKNFEQKLVTFIGIGILFSIFIGLMVIMWSSGSLGA